MLRAVIFALMVGLASLEVAGETVYVDDTLRVGIRDNPGSRDAAVEVVTAGDKLQVINRQDNYVQVITASGNQGWLSSNYVVEAPPARVRINDVISERDQLLQQMAALKQKDSSASAELSQAKVEVALLESESEQLRTRLAELTREENPYLPLYLLLATLVLFLFGFMLGLNWYKKRIQARLGGLAF